MSQASIHGTEHPILKVFSNEFIFTIPNFQRPYAWVTEQASELIEDLLAFMGEGSEPIEMLPPYFLGSIVLIKGDKPDAKVVDGQQRLTTLAILISVLRSLVPQEHRDDLTDVLYDKGKPIAGIPRSYRLTLRERDNPFFQKYICHEDGLEALKNLTKPLPESQQNICENALFFSNRLAALPEQQCFRLAQFILTRCFLIVVSTPDLDSAYRIFSVLNDRGLNLSHTDILKAEIIGKLPQAQQDDYNAKWEEIEASLGREMFQSLFAYIRTIYHKVKPQDTILKEFRTYVHPAGNPQHFIDEVLQPYADAFYDIKHEAYQSVKGAEYVNNMFSWLNKIDNSDWLPPALLYYSRNEHDQNKLLRFFTNLERLAAGLMIIRANVNKRIERYALLLMLIENNADLYAFNSPLQLTTQEKIDISEALDGHLYGWSHCKYVLLHLEEAYTNIHTPYQYKDISVEHVLPQHPRVGSTWLMEFPDKVVRDTYVHRLGNLVLLTQKKNSAAQNYDFKEKVDSYFKKGNIDLFALTFQVINETEWTPFVVERRQKELVNKLKDIWRLN